MNNKEILQKAKKDKVDLVICDYYKYYNDLNREHIKIIPFYESNNHKCSVTSMPGAVCKLIKKDIITENKIEFLEKHFFEDNAIMPYLCALCNKFSYINKPYYYYLHRDGSILHQQKYNKKWEDIFSSLDNLYNKFLADNFLVDEYDHVLYAISFVKKYKGLYSHIILDDIEKLTKAEIDFVKAIYMDKSYSSFIFILFPYDDTMYAKFLLLISSLSS